MWIIIVVLISLAFLVMNRLYSSSLNTRARPAPRFDSLRPHFSKWTSDSDIRPASIEKTRDSLVSALFLACSTANASASQHDHTNVEQAAIQLAQLNKIDSPTSSPYLSAKWALIYTGKSTILAQKCFGEAIIQQPSSSSSSSSSLLQQINKQAYMIIRDKFPLLAGAAVGNGKPKIPLLLSTDPSPIDTKPASSQSSPSSSPGGATNIQVINIQQGTVDNIVKFKGPPILGSPKFEITVSGKAWVSSPTRLSVAFECFVLKVKGLEKVIVPLKWLGPPTGEVETVYLDESVRISVGDKGGLYIATVKKNWFS